MFPLDIDNENKILEREGNISAKSSKVKVGLLSHVNENLSLIPLVMRLKIGRFGGVDFVFMALEKAICGRFPLMHHNLNKGCVDSLHSYPTSL